MRHLKLMLGAGLLAAATAFAADTPSKTTWALLTGELGNDSPTLGIINYDLSKPEEFTLIHDLTTNGTSIMGGLMVDGVFYWLDYTPQIYGYNSGMLRAYDTEDGIVRVVGDYNTAASGPMFCSPTYDYQTKTVYALNGFNAGDGLVTVSLEDGTISTSTTFSGMIYNEEYRSGDSMKAIAFNYDGDLYGISYWGHLYKINPMSAECSFVADLDYNPEKAIMYPTAIQFDNDTNQLYWEIYTYYTRSTELRRINIADGTTELVGDFGKSLLSGFDIPFTVAAAGAPAKVSDFAVIPSANGALSVTLSWTNPTRTYGRGGRLESLQKLELYRNNELLATFDDPGIGAAMTYQDNVPASALYSYKVVPYNEGGRGDRSSVTMYVGQGIPMPVTNLVLEPYQHKAHLTWTAPSTAKFDAYLDTESLSYDIVRSDGVEVAKDLKVAEYVDQSLDSLARWSYKVTAHTVGGYANEVMSNEAVCGPAVQAPYTFGFETEKHMDVWTNLDGNGDGVRWQYNSWPPTQRGVISRMNAMYPVVANDYFISPKVELKAGQHYKVTFDATPGNKNVPEDIAVSFGKTDIPAQMDSVIQFQVRSAGTVGLRASLPVVEEDGDYNFGFVHRTVVSGYSLLLSNISVVEDHDGTLKGRVNDGRHGIKGATVTISGTTLSAESHVTGEYEIPYLLQGEYEVTASALGFRDKSVTVSITEYETTTQNFSLEAIPTHVLTGRIIDVAGDPVPDAAITVGGYNSYVAKTDGEGRFEIPQVYEHEAYSLTVTRNNMLAYSEQFDVTADKDFGDITMDDNVKAPRKVEVTDNGTTATVAWGAPLNDPQEMSYDNGTPVSALGLSSGTGNSVFGNIVRQPSVVYGCSFFIQSTPSVSHYSVHLYIFDLDANGEPTDRVLYHNSYVSAKDDQWTSYTLPAPIDCPNGYMIGVACSGFVGLSIDNGSNFAEHSNCYTGDYTTGKWVYLEDANYRQNFCIRSNAATYGPCGDQPRFCPSRPERVTPDILPELAQPVAAFTAEQLTPQPMRTVEDRVRYDVYRAVNSNTPEAMEWQKIANDLKSRQYDDTDWQSLSQGVYRYGVKAKYTAGGESPITVSDSIGRNMSATVNVAIVTNTPTNEADGTYVDLHALKGGDFNYQAQADAEGKLTIDNVWKTTYMLIVHKDGYQAIQQQVDLTADNSYDFSFDLIENKTAPRGLQVLAEDDNDAYSRLMVWNFPELILDGFESHEDFAIGSAGEVGWLYRDGDGAQTGGFTNYSWPGMCEPMSFMVFNPSATEPAMADYNLQPRSGDKFLVSFASYGTANDDWLISPRLYFTEDFKFKFYAKSYDTYYLETYQVGYSLTGTEPDDFIWLNEAAQPGTYWWEVSYDIPAAAKHVAIHHISDQKRIFMLDDVRIGIPSRMNAPMAAPAYMPRQGAAYDVYLDGEKLAQTDDTQYALTGLSDGRHTAGVVAVYTSGESEMTSLDFEVGNEVGILNVASRDIKVTLKNRILTIDGEYDNASLVTMTGITVPLTGSGRAHDLTGLNAGVYVLKVMAHGRPSIHKIELR